MKDQKSEEFLLLRILLEGWLRDMPLHGFIGLAQETYVAWNPLILLLLLHLILVQEEIDK